MKSVATLTTTSQSIITEDVVTRIAAFLPNLTRTVQNTVYAWDVFFEAPTPNYRAMMTALRQAIANHPVDVTIQPAQKRKKKLLIADMDSTIIAQEALDELADVVHLGSNVARITEQAMNGELDFRESLLARVALLKGIEASVAEKILDKRITLTAGAKTLVQTMRLHGAKTILASGGFTLFTEAIGKRVGFDHTASNRLIVKNGRLTGEIAPPFFDKEAKKETLLKACAEMGITPEEAIAVGDGANDVAMLETAGVSVAFRAKEVAKKSAYTQIDYSDLSALLCIQGYAQNAFAV